MDRLTRMTRMNYDGMGGAREYIMKIVDMTSKQSELKILIAKSFLVRRALNSMPSEFDQLKLKHHIMLKKADGILMNSSSFVNKKKREFLEVLMVCESGCSTILKKYLPRTTTMENKGVNTNNNLKKQ